MVGGAKLLLLSVVVVASAAQLLELAVIAVLIFVSNFFGRVHKMRTRISRCEMTPYQSMSLSQIHSTLVLVFRKPT